MFGHIKYIKLISGEPDFHFLQMKALLEYSFFLNTVFRTGIVQLKTGADFIDS